MRCSFVDRNKGVCQFCGITTAKIDAEICAACDELIDRIAEIDCAETITRIADAAIRRSGMVAET